MNKKIGRSLFSIEILDKTKKVGDTWDVALVPTESCIKKLKGYNMVFKKMKNGGVIIFESDGIQKPLRVDKAEPFTFYLKPMNRVLESKLAVSRAVFDGTSLLTLNGTGTFYFDNLDNTGKILRGGTFSLFQQNNKLTEADKALLIGSDSTIRVKEDLKIKIIQRGIEADTEKERSRFEMKNDTSKPLNFNKLAKDTPTQTFIDLPNALYTMSWDGTNPQSLNVYKSDELIRESPFGIVEIFENKNMLLNQTTHYTLEITRSSIWRYMIVQDKAASVSDLVFNVKSGSISENFDRIDNTSLVTADNRLELDIIKRFEQDNKVSVVVFKSQNKLPIDKALSKTGLLTWKQVGKPLKETKDYLPTPTTDSGEVIITYKIGDS
jgi:hypothetical protein